MYEDEEEKLVSFDMSDSTLLRRTVVRQCNLTEAIYLSEAMHICLAL